MVTFEGLERDPLNRLKLLLLKLFYLRGEHDLGRQGGVNTRCLDTYYEVAAVLHKLGGVQSQDTSLIGLCNIRENDIDHGHEHTVLLGVTGVLNDWDYVRSFLRHVHEVASRSLGEFNSVNTSFGTDQVRDVRDSGSGGASQVENLASGLHVNVADTVSDCSCELGSVEVPDTVLCFRFGCFVLYEKKTLH